MPDRAAPRVFISYARDSPPAHAELVRQFATFLRTQLGIDAHLDQWYETVRRDWMIWAAEHLTDADFILAIASPEYRRAADGPAAPDEDRKAQFQAAIIRDNLAKDLPRSTERILPVVLPGQSARDIPMFLNPHSTTTFHIGEFTRAGVSDLLAAITGRGRYPLPELGKWQGDDAESAPGCQTATLLTAMRWQISSPDLKTGSAQINGVQYDNSIVCRRASSTVEPRAFVEVDLDGTYRRITSVVGVLDDAGEQFQVGHFKICLDGTLRWENKAAVGKPVAVELNITGARTLRLEMSRGNPAISSVPLTGRPPELAWGNPTLL
jgi:hypothetical protein